jgi:Flp pilus assembly protein TadB
VNNEAMGVMVWALLVGLIYLQVAVAVYLVRRHRERERIARLREVRRQALETWEARRRASQQRNAECRARLQADLQADQSDQQSVQPPPLVPKAAQSVADRFNEYNAASQRRKNFARHVGQFADEAGRRHWAEEWKEGK